MSYPLGKPLSAMLLGTGARAPRKDFRPQQ
jgi:hypothetical protein